ncbi:cofactor-independent phosphoglycerate mutase [Candidatus Acetothermia bacterium]|nr:cofactor-independent phosphoglycerate mutase [Candidatus Acetothermia bacterium]MBI3642538.1 cofactor-independent phosphoglycerate mutase [Candidatus Acetothermia bacterium]
MKYVILVSDGMADEPVSELGNRTPLEAARTPNMDALTKQAEVFGLARTIPDGFEPGSDVGNMSIFGYDPKKYYTGRAPIEALSLGIDLIPSDVAVRCNLVKLAVKNGQTIMEDYSAGHISTEKAHELITLLKPALEDESFTLYPGVSYRHILLWRQGEDRFRATPPHNIPGQVIDKHLPSGQGSEVLLGLIEKSQKILKNEQANSIWLWGAGKKPSVPTLQKRFGIQGAVISAVDLIRGLGICAGLEVILVPGATGYLDTNYRGKVEAALRALQKNDFVSLHIEAPDETGHEGSVSKKVLAIEDFDSKVVGPLLAGLKTLPDFSLLLMPDHPTPVSIRTHTADPVPFLIYRKSKSSKITHAQQRFTESFALKTGILRDEAHHLIEELLQLNN